MGALIGDALGVGSHWYYDLDQLRRDYGEQIDCYVKPKPDRYHAGLEAGENSQTGQVATFLLESVYEQGKYQDSVFTWSYEAARDTGIKIEPALTACRLFGLACTLGFLLPAAYYFTSHCDPRDRSQGRREE